MDPMVRDAATGTGADGEQILLTGATGFFGAFLLDELLTKTDRTINCLVRAPDAEKARHRVRENLMHFDRWDPGVADRIVVTPGDLSSPRIGLEEKVFQRLAETTGAIYHNGALVNYLFPLSRMRAVNLAGTRSLIELATMTTAAKELHFVSMSGQDPFTAYGQSKLEAEEIVRKATADGVQTAVFKISRLAPDLRTGLWNKNDILVRLLDIVLQTGIAPDIEFSEDWVSVDAAAAAIVGTTATPCSGQSFSLIPREFTSFAYMLEVAREHGYGIEVDSLSNWRKRVRATGSPQYELTIRALRLDDDTAEFNDMPPTTSVAQQPSQDGFANRALDVPGVGRAALDSFFARRRMHDDAPPRAPRR
jgi:myxalamid-type nonribosomal peptide synthetase MxaA